MSNVSFSGVYRINTRPVITAKPAKNTEPIKDKKEALVIFNKDIMIANELKNRLDTHDPGLQAKVLKAPTLNPWYYKVSVVTNKNPDSKMIHKLDIMSKDDNLGGFMQEGAKNASINLKNAFLAKA